MKEVKINGKTYVRTAAAAKLFGYSQDYLGQLAREGRIAAKRVGRTWFVDPDSIRDYQAELEAEVTQNQKAETDGSHPVIQADNKSHAVSVHPASTDPPESAEQKVVPSIPIDTRQSGTVDLSTSGIRDTSSRIPEVHVGPSRVSEVGKIQHVPLRQPSSALPSRNSDKLNKGHPSVPSYQTDATELYPSPDKKKQAEQPTGQESKPSRDTKKNKGYPTRSLRVHASSDRYSIVPSELPTVRLRGRVRVVADSDDVESAPDASTEQVTTQIADLRSRPQSSPSTAGSSDSTVSSVVHRQDTESLSVIGSSSRELESVPQTPVPYGQLSVALSFVWLSLVGLFILYGSLSVSTLTVIDTNADTTVTTWQLSPFSLVDIWTQILE